jgi:hypothetical protein
MATSYRAVARLKLEKDGKTSYIERGDKVSASDVTDGKEGLERLLQSRSILTEAEFAVEFPGFDKEAEDGANQAPGTPSNLAEIPPSLESSEGKEAAEAEAKAKAAAAEADAKAAKEALDAEAKLAKEKNAAAKASGKEDK